MMEGVRGQLLAMLMAAIVLVAGGGAYATMARPSSGSDAAVAARSMIDAANSQATQIGDGVTIVFTGTDIELHRHLPWTAGVDPAVSDMVPIQRNVFPSMTGIAAAPPFAIFVLPNGSITAAAWGVGDGAIAEPACTSPVTVVFTAGTFGGGTVAKSISLDCSNGAPLQ
jgi:hypothetical protein